MLGAPAESEALTGVNFTAPRPSPELIAVGTGIRRAVAKRERWQSKKVKTVPLAQMAKETGLATAANSKVCEKVPLGKKDGKYQYLYESL